MASALKAIVVANVKTVHEGRGRTETRSGAGEDAGPSPRGAGMALGAQAPALRRGRRDNATPGPLQMVAA